MHPIRRWLQEVLQPLRTPKEICVSLEEYLLEAQGSRAGRYYSVLRSRDTGEYVFWMSEKRDCYAGLWKASRYSGFEELLEGVVKDYKLDWTFSG